MTTAPTTTTEPRLETKQDHIDAAVDAIQMVRKGETQLRTVVASWRRKKWSFDEMTLLLSEHLEEPPKPSYLEDIAKRCRVLQMLPPGTRGKQGPDPVSVENPERLSEALPDQRSVKAFANAPLSVRREVIDEAMNNPDKVYTEAELKQKVNAAKGELTLEHLKETDQLKARIKELEDSQPFDVDYARKQEAARCGNHLVQSVDQITAEVQRFVDLKEYFDPRTVSIIEDKLSQLRIKIQSKARL